MNLLRSCVVLSGFYTLVPNGVWAQAREFKSYKTHEAYCQDNPKMPTCIKMKPFNVEALNPGYKPTPRRVVTAPVTAPASPSMIVLGEPDWRFAHPRADMLGGMNVTGVIRSPIVRMLLTELASKSGMGAADVERGLARAGDIEKVAISVRAKDILVLMTGKLDSIESLAKPSGGMNYHRVSADSILMGTEPSLSEAMRRLAAPKLASVQAQRAKDLSQTNDFWLRGTPALLASFGTPAKATDITDFTLSLQVRDQLRMDMVLNAPTPAGAQRMFASYRQNESKKPAAGQVSANVEGRAVHFVYTMQESEARLGLQELMSGPAGKQIASVIAAGKQTVGDASPSTPRPSGKVVIYGLDGGPKEIPLPNH